MTDLFVAVSTFRGDGVKISKAHKSLRKDLVESKDDGRKVLVETTTADPRFGADTDTSMSQTPAPESVTKWRVLYPDPCQPESFTNPIPGDPLYFLVYFFIKPDRVKEFIEILVEEAALVHQLEKGSIRFDLWQSLDKPTDFVVLECVKDWAAIEEHKAFPHYQKVKAALERMEAKPRSHDKGYQVLESFGTMHFG